MGFVLFALLSGCTSVPTASATVAEPPSVAPGDWFYADRGGAVDWESVRFAGADVVFRTVGEGLRSGPVRGASWLACGEATRATLRFVEGVLHEVHTSPEVPCVEAAARALDFTGLHLDGAPIEDAAGALVVYDVPAEVACSSCS